MLTKFKNLIFAKRPPEDPISKEIDFYIENSNWDIVLSAVGAGYPLSAKQIKRCIQNIGNSSINIDQIQEYLVKNHKTEIVNYIRPFLDKRVRYVDHHETLIAFANFVANDKFKDCLETADLKKILNIANKYKRLFGGTLIDTELKKYCDERFIDEKQDLLKKINANYIKPVKSLLKDLPETVQLQVKMINQLVDQIDSSKLSGGSKAELNTLLEVTLPKLVGQYAAIDESMLGFKNEKEQTVDDILTDGLKQVRNSLKDFVEAIEQQKIKELKITARQLSAAK